jgi:hypothetical protein
MRLSQNSTVLEAIAFHLAEQVLSLAPQGLLDIAFTPTFNTWQGRSDIELHVRAIRPHINP